MVKVQLTAQDKRNNAKKLRIDTMKGVYEGPLVKLCRIRRPQCVGDAITIGSSRKAAAVG